MTYVESHAGKHGRLGGPANTGLLGRPHRGGSHPSRTLSRLTASYVERCPRRRGRLFQFAAKYWFGCSASLVGILWLSQDVPALRPWNPLYVIFTMVVILSEKVPPLACASVRTSQIGSARRAVISNTQHLRCCPTTSSCNLISLQRHHHPARASQAHGSPTC